jgi:GNAT superfamily N-acetyltransferase
MINIRRAASDDAAEVARVFLDSFHATYDFPLAHTETEVREWIRDDVIPTREAWVAIEDQVIVGLLVVAPGWVQHRYVPPDRLGQGIGRRLLDLAKERSPDRLTLWTFQVNARARRFYERNGFMVAEETDGSGNEERQPDVRYVWSPAGSR